MKKHSEKLSRACFRMAIATRIFLFCMLLLNAVAWMWPGLQENGLVFSLSGSLLEGIDADISALPWWQKAGGIAISSLPLVVLTAGLWNLQQFFGTYARQAYFSADVAVYLGKTGKMVMLWVVLTILCEPLLSIWVTMTNPVGSQMISLSFTSGYIVALFLAGCISVIAHILRKASHIHAENEMFV